jgi:hypothetical protein
MGKTRRDIAHTGMFRNLRVASHQRTSGKAIADLVGIPDADEDISALIRDIPSPSSRLLQQYHRHTIKFPTSHDDLPVAGIDEGAVRVPASVMLWHAGMQEPISITVAKLKEYLEQLRDCLVTCVELRFGDCIAVVPLQTARIEVEKVTPDVIGPAHLTRLLGLHRQSRYQRRDPNELLREIMGCVAYKPSRIIVEQVLLENGGVILPRGKDCEPSASVVGATVQVQVPGLLSFRGEPLYGISEVTGQKVGVVVNSHASVTLDRPALLAAGYGVTSRYDLGNPITWQFWFKARRELYGVVYWATERLIVSEPGMA